MGKISSYPEAGSFDAGDVLIGNHGGVTSRFGPAALAAAFTAPAVPPPSRLVNGWFDIWQAGPSAATTGLGTAYGPDQWWFSGKGDDYTVSRQAFAKGQTSVPGDPAYFCRVTRAVASVDLQYGWISAIIEGAAAHAGQVITVSFWAKASEAVEILLSWIQKFGTGGSPSAAVTTAAAAGISLATGWQRHAVTITVPSAAGKTFGSNDDDHVELRFSWRDNSGGASASIDLAAVQIDLGNTALAERRPDLTASQQQCSRYFQLMSGISVQAGATAGGFAATQSFPVEMRAIPAASIGAAAAENGVSAMTVEYITTRAATPYLASGAGYAYYNNFNLTLDARIVP